MVTTDFRKIIIIRHGVYDATDRLDATGQRQMQALIDPLKQHLAGESNVLLLTSSAPRAEDSMKILSEGLGLPYEAHPYFWSDNGHSQDNFRAKELLIEKATEKKADVIVLVTHLEYANGFPRYIVAEAGKSFVRYVSMEKGDMLFIDMEKEITRRY